MVSRFYESSVWESGGFPLSFATRNLSGQRVISFSSTGPLPTPQISCVWESDGPETPQQLLTGFHSAREVHDEYLVKLAQGYGPAYAIVTRARVGDPRYALIWERLPTGARVNPATVTAVGYDAFHAKVYEFWDARERALYLRSVHAVLLETPNRVPLFIGTMWPFDGASFSWSLRKQRDTSIDHNFIDLYGETIALSCAGMPWLALPIPGSGDIVTLWRDQIFEPWTREPFDRAAKRHHHFLASVGMSSDGLEARIDRNASERELLSVACSGLGTSQEPPRFNGIWIRKGRAVLPRTFHMWGPGNLDNAVFSPPRVPAAHRSLAVPRTAPVLPRRLAPAASSRSSLAEREPDLLATRRLRLREPSFGGGPAGEPRKLEIGDGSPTVSGASGARVGSVMDQQSQASPELATHPFDVFMRAEMLKYGAHMAHIAVLRNDELAYLRGYTNAEQGYPTATTSTRFKCVSVSKILTASVLVPQYLRKTPAAPLDGLRNATFAAELGISRPGEPAFEAITMFEAVRHESGISDSTVFVAADESAYGPDAVKTGYDAIYQALKGNVTLPTFVEKELQAGDMRLALQSWKSDLVTLPAGTRKYSNVVYIALSELTGSKLGLDYDRYTGAVMRSAIPEELRARLESEGITVLTGEGYLACVARNEAPYHGQWINVGLNPYGGGAFMNDAYLGNPRFGSGAGWWALSAVEMAQVLRQLSSGENPNWPSLVEKEVIADNRLGWDGAAFLDFTPAGGILTPYWGLWKDGGGTGCSSWCVHLFNGNDSVTIYVAFSVDGPDQDNSYPAKLVVAAQQTEDRGLWSPFDLLGLDLGGLF